MTAVKMLWGPASVGQIAAQSGALGSAALNNSTNKAGNVFCLPSDGTIDQVGFYISAKNGTPPAYNVGIVTLDSSGNPTTTPYGSSTITSYTPTSTGWKWVTLGTGATANSGDMCAVVVYPGASAPDGSNNISVTNVSFAAPGNANSYAFGTWSPTILSTAIAVHYSTGTVYGYALGSNNPLQSIRSNTTPDEVGCKFTLPANMTCYGGRFAAELFSWGASATFDLVLYNNSNSVVASVSVSDKDFVARAVYADVYWDGVSLTAGDTYRLIVKPTTASSGDIGVQRYVMESTAAMGMWPCGDTWQGTSRTDAGAWTDASTDMYYMGIWVSDITFSAGALSYEYGYIG